MVNKFCSWDVNLTIPLIKTSHKTSPYARGGEITPPFDGRSSKVILQRDVNTGRHDLWKDM
jgi:hypothetical protein